MRVSASRQAAGADDAARAARSVNAAAVELYKVLDREDGNVVFSPSSIETALSMALQGARGETAAQMAKVLHSADPRQLASAMNGLDRLLHSRNGERTDTDHHKGHIELDNANSLWGQQGEPFEKRFLTTLAEQYGTGMHTVDYKKATEQARRAINGWVADNTHHRIKELIPANSLDSVTRLVLVNALYFKAPWNSPFDKAGTAPRDFHRLDGSTVKAPLMSLDTHLSYGHGQGWESVSMPYAGNELAMTVIVPNEGRFDEVERTLDAGELGRTLAGGQDRQVMLKLPKFDFRQRFELSKTLRQLGMVVPFDDSGLADFKGIVSDPKKPLYISKVHHQATITVDEKGSEASAATSVEMGQAGAASGPRPPKPVVLTVDRPFLFAIHDISTGAVLFMGRVVDPTK